MRELDLADRAGTSRDHLGRFDELAANSPVSATCAVAARLRARAGGAGTTTLTRRDQAVAALCHQQGVVVLTAAPTATWSLLPPLVIGDDLLDEASVLEGALREVLGSR